MRVESYRPAHLSRLHHLVNLHLGAVIPGWSLSAADIARHLRRDETEGVVDPWVAERRTLCVADGYTMHAAAHLLRYGDGPEVGEHFRGIGEIAWFLARPRSFPEEPPPEEAAAAMLAAARAQFAAWGVARESGWGAGLPAGPFGGVPDAWPHVAAALEAAGYHPRADHHESLYGGAIPALDAPPDAPPVAGVTLRRGVGRFGVRFAALAGAEEIGHCEVLTDLTNGGAVPAPRGWAELSDLWVREGWRDRGIGGWLVRHATTWLRLAGGARIVFSVADEDDAAGAGRFYRRFGWQPFARAARVWERRTEQ